MVQTSSNDARISELKEALEVLRDHEQTAVFHAISRTWLGILSALPRLSRTSVDNLTEFEPEKLYKILLYSTQQDGKLRAWLNTWAEAAFELSVVSADLRDAMTQEKKATPQRWAERCLNEIQRLSDTTVIESDESSNLVDAVFRMAPPTRRKKDFDAATLSEERFSTPLRESLPLLNAELEYLTLDQIDTLENCLHHRALWVQGPSGSGKTIFGIEAGSRALRAGLRVLFVYRSTQFGHILNEVLKSSTGTLRILQHQVFDQLLKNISDSEPGDAIYEQHLRAHFHDLDAFAGSPFFDLVVVDDCETFEIHVSDKAEAIKRIATRVIMITSNEKVISHPLFHKADISQDAIDSTLDEQFSHPLVPPKSFHVVELTRNLRNAKKIANYIDQFCDGKVDAALEQPGNHVVHQSSWESLADDVVTIVEQALSAYVPHQIRILTDPYLTLSFDDNQQTPAMLSPLASAIVEASKNGCFNETTIDADSELKQTLQEKLGSKAVFISTDGSHVHSVVADELRVARDRVVLMDGAGPRVRDRIENDELLEDDVFSDPFQSANAIMIYQSPLFIGLEADMVIYVRNSHDRFLSNVNVSDEWTEKLIHARRHHHYLAMCCARHYLIDLQIT